MKEEEIIGYLKNNNGETKTKKRNIPNSNEKKNNSDDNSIKN